MKQVCYWCKGDAVNKPTVPGEAGSGAWVVHMDYDTVFCSKKCADLFFQEMSERPSSAKATADRQDAKADVEGDLRNDI